MKVYYNTTTNKIVFKNKNTAKKSGDVELEYVNSPIPAYDKLTHKLVKGTNIDSNTYTLFYMVEELSVYDKEIRDWKFPLYPQKLVIDEVVAESDKGVKHFIRFDILGNPIEYDESTQQFTVWVDGINSKYQSDFNAFLAKGQVTIVDRPSVL